MTDPSFVSTGHLPAAERVQRLVDEAHSRFREISDGAPSSVYPALQRVPVDLFGICVADVSGAVYQAGDVDYAFTIMSVAKPYAFALACDAIGPEQVGRRVGVNATGLPFNSHAAVEQSPDGRTNPMVNAGAIVAASLLPGATLDERWVFLRQGLSRFAGRELELDDEVLASALATNYGNRQLARLLRGRGQLSGDPDEAVTLYTRQCALSVTASDLALMGATLADGGVHPGTKVRVVGASAARHSLAVMATAGLYETSGDWLYDVGLPGKSGIGGGIVTVSPGKGALGTFAPPLDDAGNSVRGQYVARFLSARLGLDLFASEAAE
jgi:glutaminase